MKKLIALVLALAMILMVGAAFATTITVTPPTGVDPDATNTYTFYKVFDAVNSASGISYKLLPGKTTAPAGFTVDVAGNVYLGTVNATKQNVANEIPIQVSEGGSTVTKYLVPQTTDLTTDQITAIANYVTAQGLTGETATSTGANDCIYTVPSEGYYYITTTTGTTVTIDSTRGNVDVDDKNEVPGPDKIITQASSVDSAGKTALQEVGKVVDYQVSFQIKKGAKGYEFHDTMTDGLQYRNDISVRIGDTVADAAAATAVATADTTWKTKTLAAGETIHIEFADAYVAANIGKYIVLKYSATVTSDALQVDPAKNTVKITYGNNSQYSSSPSETKVYNAKITVTKADGAGNALGGAGFVLKNASGQYYKYNAATSGENPTVASITWYSLAANETLEAAIAAGKITQNESDGTTGIVPSFVGLADGNYTLVESKVPAGYNKAADVPLTIKSASTANFTKENNVIVDLALTSTVVNNSGTELPSTGGIGTTIFYILGGLLVVGAAVILVARRKAHD